MDQQRKKKKKNDWTPVPQFGAWDNKAGGGATNYSMVFSKARADRKQHKTNVTARHSIGNEKELVAKHEQEVQLVTKNKNALHYLSCCLRP